VFATTQTFMYTLDVFSKDPLIRPLDVQTIKTTYFGPTHRFIVVFISLLWSTRQ